MLDGAPFAIADAAAFIAELDNELAERAAAFPAAIAKGRLRQEEADHVTRLIGDIRADLFHAFSTVDCELTRADPAFTWNAKVTWIRAELDELEEKAPDAVAKGRMTADQARRKLAMFRLLRRLYWREMFMWLPASAAALDYLRDYHGKALAAVGGPALRAHMESPGGQIYRQLVRDHMELIEAESGGQGALSIGAAAPASIGSAVA